MLSDLLDVHVRYTRLIFYVYVDHSEFFFVFFFQAEDGIRDLVRSRGLGDVYKRQNECCNAASISCSETSPAL